MLRWFFYALFWGEKKEAYNDEKRNFAGLFGTLSDSDKKSLINEVLNGLDYNFIVTPKEVDFQIDRLSSVISSGINGYIHGTKVSN